VRASAGLPSLNKLFNYLGTYTCNQGTGSVQIGVASHDQSDPVGDLNSDAVLVSVLDGPYAGYFNYGLVQKGIIQFKPAKTK
jgi:hypothetical protein